MHLLQNEGSADMNLEEFARRGMAAQTAVTSKCDAYEKHMRERRETCARLGISEAAYLLTRSVVDEARNGVKSADLETVRMALRVCPKHEVTKRRIFEAAIRRLEEGAAK